MKPIKEVGSQSDLERMSPPAISTAFSFHRIMWSISMRSISNIKSPYFNYLSSYKVLSDCDKHSALKMHIFLTYQCPLLCTQDSTQPLSLLSSGTSVRRDLDKNVGFRQIERRVRNFAHKNCVDLQNNVKKI